MLRLHAFGGLRLEGPDGLVTGPAAGRRPLALLALVAASGSRGITRERIVGILWPDGTEEQGRHALAQALYALRKDLAAGDLFEPAGAGLRLNRSILTSDVGDFLQALDRRDRGGAIALYAGPFLDGVYLPQAPEFERWAEEERERLSGLYRHALEEEAAALESASAPERAAVLWRRVVALDPLATTARLRLMRALAAAGEPAAAIEEARLHREAVRREMLPPAEEIVELEQSLRRRPTSSPESRPEPASAESVPAQAQAQLRSRAPARPRGRQMALTLAIAGMAVVVAGLAIDALRTEAPPIVAVGVVESHLANDSTGIAASLGDLLATQLVQVRSLRVVSRARLLEVLGRDATSFGPGDLATAARLAGSDELIEGVLYADPAGLRLDLRRTGLEDGQVHEAISTTAPDAVSLVETAVAALARTWGLPEPTTPLRAVTSVSLVARRYYDQGLRALYAGEYEAATGLFRLALAEDSTFAMAAFYLARSEAPDEAHVWWRRAMELAPRATDRERLLILATGGLELNDARGLAYAETLAVRYPEDLDGIRILGELRLARGDFDAAGEAFDRVVRLDSAGRTGKAARCHACEAQGRAIWAALTGDSLARAERLARSMAGWPGGAISAPAMLATVLLRQGRIDAAVAAAREAARREPSVSAEAVELDGMFRAGELPRLDSIMSARLVSAQLPESRSPVLERLSRTRREGGRPRAALALARERERLNAGAGAAAPFIQLERALSLLELGREEPSAAKHAAALFDTIATIPAYDEPRMARHRAWMWTHVATALARAGDTAALPALARRIEGMAARSSYGRDRRLSYYVEGLLKEARGDWEGARLAYTASVWSRTENMVAPRLARAALRAGRPRDAVDVLSAYLRGPLDAANQYVPRWEVHRLLGDAHRALGRADSARINYDWVKRALARGEPEYRALADSLP